MTHEDADGNPTFPGHRESAIRTMSGDPEVLGAGDEPLSDASMELLNKIAPHPRDNATELQVRAARNRRLAFADDLRAVERTVRLDTARDSRPVGEGLREADRAAIREAFKVIAVEDFGTRWDYADRAVTILDAAFAAVPFADSDAELDALLAEQSEDDRLDAASSLAIDRLETERGYVKDGQFVSDPIGAYVRWDSIRAAVRPATEDGSESVSANDADVRQSDGLVADGPTATDSDPLERARGLIETIRETSEELATLYGPLWHARRAAVRPVEREDDGLIPFDPTEDAESREERRAAIRLGLPGLYVGNSRRGEFSHDLCSEHGPVGEHASIASHLRDVHGIEYDDYRRQVAAAVRPVEREGLDLPERVVVGANGAYWRDYGDHYSMAVVSDDNDPVEIVATYRRRVDG